MGREIRRVPKGWEHPQYDLCPHWGGIEGHNRYHPPGDWQHGKCFVPLNDEDYITASQEWKEGFEQWEAGTHDWLIRHPEYKEKWEYWEYDSPPDPDFCHPAWTEEEATCYQIYETVSEGTPVSPVFETLEEMEKWLIEQGYSEKAAKGFVKEQWVPSMMIGPGIGIVNDIEIAGIDKQQKGS